jgi:hypothetical protein
VPGALKIRGTIEGFYGPPWSPGERLDHLRFSAAAGLDTYVYAPKDDPFHRRRWREPYPKAELDRLGDLIRCADEAGVRFVYALHPALSMRFAQDDEHAALAAKALQLHDAGVRQFALLFDDVPPALTDPADVERFGAGGLGLGAAHGVTVRRFATEVLAPRGLTEPLLVCPTDYAGIEPSPYRDGFAREAPEDILITWTGRDVVVGSVTRAEIDRAAETYRRPLVLWDNFPVNDFEPSRLFLGPVTGRATELEGSALVGVIANAMIQARPSQVPLATVADWAADPAAYQPQRSAASALSRWADDSLAPFVRVCSAWPPSADQDPELTAACAGALDGNEAGFAVVEQRLSELAACARSAREPGDLVTALRPWLAGAAAMADAGVLAVRLLRAIGDGADLRTLRDATRGALEQAEEHYESVLRPIVAPFVRAALRKAGWSPDAPGPAVVVVGDPTPDPTVELLAECGFAPRRYSGSLDSAAAVVVTGATPDDVLGSVAAAAVPVVAWGVGLVGLKMAARTDAAILWEGLSVLEPDDPLALGSPELPVYRGPAWSTQARVGSAAQVIARGPEGPAVFRYPRGAELCDGSAAPAERIGLFLTSVGPARWLLTATGRAVFRAALTEAVGSPG